jgi:hypothetical protein
LTSRLSGTGAVGAGGGGFGATGESALGDAASGGFALGAVTGDVLGGALGSAFGFALGATGAGGAAGFALASPGAASASNGSASDERQTRSAGRTDFRWITPANSMRFCHDDPICAAAEQARFDHSGHLPEGVVDGFRVGQGLHRHVIDVVARVGGHRDAVEIEAQHGLTELGERSRGGQVREDQHLDRHGAPLPEPFAEFRLVHDDDVFIGREIDDLLARVRAASTLDQVERTAHFVRAVDA